MASASSGFHRVEWAPNMAAAIYPCPQCELHPPSTSARDTPRPAGRSDSGVYQITLRWVLVRVRFVCTLRMKSPFPEVIWDSWNWAPQVLKTKCFRSLSSQCQTSGLEARCGLRAFTPLEKLCNINIFQLVGYTPRGMGLDYIMSPLLFPIFSCKRYFLIGFGLFHR